MKLSKETINETSLPEGVDKKKANENLEKLDKLQGKVTEAHKKTKIKEEDNEMKIDKYRNIEVWKKAKKRKAKERKMKLADEERKRQLKKYDSAEGNRKKRRDKQNKLKRRGDRFAKLQLIPRKKKKDKIIYLNGKWVLASPQRIPYGEQKKIRIIKPKFMWVPFERIYHGNVTIENEIRRIETGRYTEWKKFLVGYETKIIKTEFNCYIPVEFKTITQHLYPPRVQKRLIENKKRLAELQKIMKESKEKQDKKEKGD